MVIISMFSADRGLNLTLWAVIVRKASMMVRNVLVLVLQLLLRLMI